PARGAAILPRRWKLPHRPPVRRQIANPGFRLKREQRALSIESARITRKVAVRTDDTVTGNDDTDRIAPGCGACGARAARTSRAARKLVVGDGPAETDRGDRLPRGPLKRRARGREHGLETLALTAEVFGELLFRLTQWRVARIPPPIW